MTDTLSDRAPDSVPPDVQAAPSLSPEPPNFSLEPKVAKAFLRFAGGYWTGETAVRAWALSIGLGVLLVVSVAATAGLNWWNRWFFDALEKRDAATAALAVPVFLGIIASMAAIGVGIVLTRETLQVRWRAWLVDQLVDRWLGARRFYHMGIMGTEPANPEYRIADDSRWATEPLTDLAIGLVQAVVGAATFISILWIVGGSYPIVVGGHTIVIPAFMVVLALLYGIVASGLMLWIGKALVGSVGHKNAAEGHFRAALTRLRENADSIALLDGAASEQRILRTAYTDVVARWLAIVRQHGRLTWITNASGPMIPLVPLLFATPKYLAGDLTLGQVTQLAAAFVQVQLAISWLVDNYNRIAEWYASARRVMDIVEACDGVDARLPRERATGIGMARDLSGGFALESVAVHDLAGRALVANADLDLADGCRLHVVAPSSVGKTVLVRAAAGLWPWGHGQIRSVARDRVMIVPQKPYLPIGTLRDALEYPTVGAPLSRAALTEALAACGLPHLADRLDKAERWEQVLSNGERQRLAFARLLLHEPRVIILDDAWSALDETSQRELLQTLKRALPEAAVLSFGQRPSIDGFHDASVEMIRNVNGAMLAPKMQAARAVDKAPTGVEP